MQIINTLEKKQQPRESDSILYNPQLRNNSDNDILQIGSTALQQQQQLLINTPLQQEIMNSRDQAIDSIESTIQELGQIYQHFALLLSSQRETVQRIDENIMDSEMNVIGAHEQLVKYYQGISGNRWLMLKVMSVLVFFFLIFVAFMK